MWNLKNPKIQRAEYNFSSSGRSNASVSQLFDDDIQLINAVEFVNWGETQLQLIVCETCGVVGCQAQGWVELKRGDSVMIIMPSFMGIENTSKSIQDEYFPPYYLIERGAIYIEKEDYENTFCQLIPVCPNFETLSFLSAWEASKIFQLEAPSHILGKLPEQPKLDQDIIIASSEGNFMEQTATMVSLINKLSSNPNPAKLRSVTEHDQIISFYLDISGFPQWKALSYNGLEYSLYLEPGYIIE